MTEQGHASVNELLAELHAHRVATWPAADLEVNVNQRKVLVDTADRSAFVAVGDVLEPFSLPEVEGGTVSLEGLLEAGPVVLLFFRFAGCPACNVALPHYRDALHPGLAELGATLVGVSPQVPGDLLAIKARHALPFPVVSDTDNALARALGIAYAPDEASRRYALAKGADVGRITGTGRWEFPMPAMVVVDAGRVVRFADVSPDWMVRTEAGDVLEAVAGIAPARTVGA
jgi:peroxiredoxin